MRKHFPSTGRGARLADAFASWRVAVITFQLLAHHALGRKSSKNVQARFDKISPGAWTKSGGATAEPQ